MFNNPWVVGIGGGILSGLLVTFITKSIFSKKENKEYLQRVITANNEIIYSLKPSISEKKLPSREIILSLISSTARKYGLRIGDLYTIEQIIEDMVKDIMDSGFISSKQKVNFCEQLATLKVKPSLDKEVTKDNVRTFEMEKAARSKRTALLSMVMGIMTGFAAILSTATLILSKKVPDLSLSKMSDNPGIMLAMIFIVTLFPVIVAFMITVLSRKKEKMRIETILDNSHKNLTKLKEETSKIVEKLEELKK